MRVSAPIPRRRAGVDVPSFAKQRWLLVPIVLAIIALIIFWTLPSRMLPSSTTSTATITQGDLTQVVSGGGSVAAARQVDLSFSQSGTITAVNVKVGDQVKAGQALAQIDTADLQLQLQQTQANLKSAQANMQQVQSGSTTPQDIASAQAALDSARAQLQQTRTGTATKADIDSAQAALDAAVAKLNALKAPSQADISSAQTKVDQANASLQNTQNGDSQTKTNAQLALQNAVNSLTQAQSKYSTAQQQWQYVQGTGNDPTNPTTTNSQGKKVSNKLNNAQRQQYYDAYIQAQSALQSAENNVSQSQVAYDAARQKEAADVPQAQAALKDAQTQLDALIHPNASDLTQAQAAVTQAQANLTKLKQGGTAAQIQQSAAGVTQAQANLDKLTAPPTDAALAAAAATQAQAEANVATAQRNLDQATLTAPFDGVVSAVNLVPGSTSGNGGGSSSSSSSSSSAAITLVDRSKLHININLSETDAAKVQVGQAVQLTFDALPETTLTGVVATVSPAATTTNNVVTYPVQVEFDPGKMPVKVGMSATANIQIQQINNALVIPSRAVQTVGNSHVVTVLQGDNQIPVQVFVTTGLTSNGQTQIISCADGSQCLQPGDVIQIPTATMTSTTGGAQNRGGLGGGFGGFGGGFGGPRPGGR